MVLLLFCDNAVSITSSGAVVTYIGIAIVNLYLTGCSCFDYLVVFGARSSVEWWEVSDGQSAQDYPLRQGYINTLVCKVV